jgi:hypothetical protein
VAGIHTGGPPFSADKVKEGFQMVTVTSDGVAMTRGVQAILREQARLTGGEGAEQPAAAGGSAY